MTTIREAAQARAAAMKRAADRPTQRRCAADPHATARVTARITKTQLRDQAETGLLRFEGFASVTGVGYEMWDFFGPYTEQVVPGAFAATLAQPDLDVPLVLAHDPLRRIARTTNGSLSLDEVLTGPTTGLHVLAPELDPTDADVAYIAPKLRSGLIDEMSFRFMITAGTWSPDWMEFHIESVDINRGDVAIVGYGANPNTAGAGLRAARSGRQVVDLADLQPYRAR